MQGFVVRAAEDRDRKPVIAIFNYYVTTGFAAYPDTPVPPGFFDLLRDAPFTRYY
jgi:L-amino acid N-acyltransferase YncA